MSEGERNAAALVYKLHRIIDKVVNNLMDKIVVRININFIGFKTHNFKALALDFLLKGKNRSANKVVYVKIRGVNLHIARLYARNAEHGAHHARQALDLVGNRLKILPPLLFGNGPVQNAVYKAADSHHRGFQLVGNVGNKASANGF